MGFLAAVCPRVLTLLGIGGLAVCAPTCHRRHALQHAMGDPCYTVSQALEGLQSALAASQHKAEAVQRQLEGHIMQLQVWAQSADPPPLGCSEPVCAHMKCVQCS